MPPAAPVLLPPLVLGLPLHALVVHAVVVLVPLAALGAVAVALVPRWRGRYGALLALLTTAAVGSVPVAVLSGQDLRDRLGYPAETFRHGTIADATLWWVLPLLLTVVALVVADRRRAGRTVQRVLAALVVVAAVAATYQVVRVGHTGTEAVWQGRVPAAAAPLGESAAPS